MPLLFIPIAMLLEPIFAVGATTLTVGLTAAALCTDNDNANTEQEETK